MRSPKFVSKILCCVALQFIFFSEQPFHRILRKLSFIRFSYKHCNFLLGCLTRQDGFQNHDKVYFATNCLCLLLRCFLFIDCFILHGLIVGDRDKMSKNKSHGSCQETIPENSSTLIRREALGTSSGSATKKMAENFTLFAIEEEIAVQMPKNIARRAKIQLDE